MHYLKTSIVFILGLQLTTLGRAEEPVTCDARLDALEPVAAAVGTSLTLKGHWPVPQGTQIAVINLIGERRVPQNQLEITSWDESTIIGTVPQRLNPGQYRVGVDCDDPFKGKPVGSSGFLDFEVLAPTPAP